LLLRTVEQTASTNEDMLADARSGALEGCWLRAITQTAGRGRMGRAWESPPGNLFASTLVRLQLHDPSPATLTLVAVVALHEVANIYASGIRFTIKWPNDLMASGAKLAGILLERADNAIVVGIGVNLAHHPEGLDRPVSSLAALTGHAPDAGEFCHDLAGAFARWLGRWRNEGLGCVTRAWEAAAHSPGTALTANVSGGESLTGLYVGLDIDGALKLRLADGSVRVIHAGDVFQV
jgi:BirA family biotin operon repressor/biotin-[acetyl-CoA-carboxylase] ligase